MYEESEMKNEEWKLIAEMATRVRSKPRAEREIKRIFFRPVTVSILCGLEVRGPRENSEKLRPMRPFRLGDDVRDIESLGGSPPSIMLSHSRPPDLRLARVYPRPPSGPFLRLLRAGAAMPIVSWLESCRLASREIWQPARHYTMTRQSCNTRGERKGGDEGWSCGPGRGRVRGEKCRSGYMYTTLGYRIPRYLFSVAARRNAAVGCFWLRKWISINGTWLSYRS